MENGFIRDILDVKVLVLYVLKLADKPLTREKIYELCFVDNRLTYFDVCEVLPQLAAAENVEECSPGVYAITEKGIANVDVLAPSIAYTLRANAAKAVAKEQEIEKQDNYISTAVVMNGSCVGASVEFKDDFGPLMKLELAAPDKSQARKLNEILRRNAARIYKAIMDDLMQELEE